MIDILLRVSGGACDRRPDLRKTIINQHFDYRGVNSSLIFSISYGAWGYNPLNRVLACNRDIKVGEKEKTTNPHLRLHNLNLFFNRVTFSSTEQEATYFTSTEDFYKAQSSDSIWLGF